MNSDETNNIDELLSFLPSFSLTDQNFIVESESEEASSIMAPFDYTDEVNQFVQLLRNEFWTDYNYLNNISSSNMNDDAFINEASFVQIKSLLMYFLRGERFCDGHWDELLNKERIKLILERLKILRENYEKE